MTGSPWIQRRKSYQRVEAWIKRWGLLVIFAIAAMPNPVFDLAGAIAGAARLGWWRVFHRVVGGAADQEHCLCGGGTAERGLHPAVFLGVV